MKLCHHHPIKKDSSLQPSKSVVCCTMGHFPLTTHSIKIKQIKWAHLSVPNCVTFPAWMHYIFKTVLELVFSTELRHLLDSSVGFWTENVEKLLNEKNPNNSWDFSPLSRTKTWTAQLWMGAGSILQSTVENNRECGRSFLHRNLNIQK